MPLPARWRRSFSHVEVAADAAGAGVVPEFFWKADDRHPRSPVIEVAAGEGDGHEGHFAVSLVAVGLAGAKTGAAEQRVSRRLQTPGRAFP